MTEITFNKDASQEIDDIDSILDREWIKTTFLLSDKDFDSTTGYKQWVVKNRYRNTADTKFTSSAIGMNMSCNARPQLTRYADIRSKGKIPDREDVGFAKPINKLINGNSNFGLGMGGYYSEAFDDRAQRIYMRFGVAAYTPLTAWFSNVFDPKRAIYANRGMISTFIIEVADVVSFAASIVAAFTVAPFLALGIGALSLFNTFTGNSSSRFFRMQPTMPAYWLAVEDILNSLLAKRTLLPTILPEYNKNNDTKLGQPKAVTDEFITTLHQSLPDIFDKEGRVSVFGLALKSQRAFNQMWHRDYKANEKTPLEKNFLDYPVTADKKGHDSYFTNNKGDPTIASHLFEKAHSLLMTKTNDDVNTDDPTSIKNVTLFDMTTVDQKTGLPISGADDPANPTMTMDDKITANVKANDGFFKKVGEYFLSELTNGAGFAVFTVDNTGTASESFSNSTQANPLEATINGMSSKIRSVSSVMTGATEIPIVGDMVKLAGDVVATVASNASYGLINPLLAMLYGVNVELPKTWETSSSDFTRADYKIKCISPYGNAISQLTNVYLPMAMILAGGLPRGTGSQSYTSPFLCQIYDRGRVQITLGMIDKINITRGTSNLPFNRKGQANAIDIDFSVVNLDNVMFSPIGTGGLVATAKQLLSPLKEDNTFADYISAVAGLDVMTQIYGVPKLRLKIATTYMKLGRYLDPDPAYFSSLAAGAVDSVLATVLTGGLNKIALQTIASGAPVVTQNN